MSKGGGSVPSIQVPWQTTQAMNQAMQQEANIAQQQQQLAQQSLNFGKELFQYGKGRTEEYADPILNQFLKMVSGTPDASGVNQFTNVLSSNMMQLPVWATQQQYDTAKKQLLDQTQPGPQQQALLANLQNQRMQNLGTQAYGRVDQMLNALLGQSGQVWQGAQAAQTGYGQAGGMLGQAAGTYGQQAGIAGQLGGMQMQAQQMNQQLQLMAQQSGNQMLGGIFNSIGQLGGYALGQYAGSPGGSAAITGMLGLA